jgi:hypothetical protein
MVDRLIPPFIWKLEVEKIKWQMAPVGLIDYGKIL